MTTMYQARAMTAPEIHPEHEVYWSAATAGKLLIKKCNACGEYHYYPRAHCPRCISEDITWVEVAGTGTIYTYSVMRYGTPYTIAFVELDEGPRMMTNIVDCDFDTLYINQHVQVVFKATGDAGNNGQVVPCFTPIDKKYN